MSAGRTGPLPQTIGQYVIREKIGSGGMATVYRAYDPAHQREVALKVLAGHLVTDANARTRFEREARMLLQFHHPHILPVYDFDAGSERPTIVMRLLDGRTLADLLHGQALAPAEVGRLARQIASALDYAHARGIIHRDIKPGNILFDADGKPYLADFGVAYLTESAPGGRLTAAGEFIGTANYASPEQCKGEPLDRPSDIYSLAVMVFQMITGQLPFQAASPLAVIKMHLEEKPPNPNSINPTLPIDLYSVLSKALAKLPEYRYPSAMKFSAALDEALGLHAVPEPDDENAWLYDDVPPAAAPDAQAEPSPAPAGTGQSDPFAEFDALEGVFFDDSFAAPEDLDTEFPESASVMDTAPYALPMPGEATAEEVPPLDSEAAPVPRPLRPLAPRPRPSRLRSIPWAWIGVYGTILISLIALGMAAVIAYGELAVHGPKLDQTVRSSPLGLALNYPAGWSAASGEAALLATAPQFTITLADRPIPAVAGPYDNATLVIAVQRIDPVAVFGIPGLCRSQIAGGPEGTFACMQRNRYVTPVYESFKTSRYQGLTLPGTLPPTTASLPMILLPASRDSWTAVIIVHWNGYPDAPDLLASVARSVRPVG